MIRLVLIQKFVTSKMPKKKRLPIEQLRQAGNAAREMLRERGIEAKTSVLEQIIAIKGAPELPGMPVYLPHQWTLKASQQMMRDLIVMWKEECDGDAVRADNITEFFKFVVARLRAQEKQYTKEVANTPRLLRGLKNVPVLRDVFSSIQKKETIGAMSRFFVDSFAVAVILKKNQSTAEYLNWFLDWTNDLYSLWVRPDKKEEAPKMIEEKKAV